MNGCFIDVPNLTLPWTAEDILSAQDIELIHAKDGASKNYSIQSKNITWTNAGKQRYDLLQAGKHTGDLVQQDIDTILAEESHFNGTAVVHDQILKRQMWEWLNDTFHADYIDNLWTGPNGASKVVPVTVLCFNKTSGWHCEGPMKTPDFEAPSDGDVDAFNRINQLRPPAVCNFKLLGDTDNSKIEFANGADELERTHELARDKCFTDYARFLSRLIKRPPNIAIVNNIRVGPVSSYILDMDQWADHLNKITEHVGMHNPYFVNVAKWHRVLTNNTPRVTFRVHSHERMTFKKIEELVETQRFFK